MKHFYPLFFAVLFVLSGCMEREGSEYENMLRSYQFGVLPLIPDTPENQYLPSFMEVSVNAIGKEGGVAVITAGYPKSEGRTMNDSFFTSFGDAYQIPANHFSVERKVINPSQVDYSIQAKENRTGKDLVFFVEISDWGMTADGKPYYNKALIVVEQAAE